jgi:hypothetical protein
MRYHKTTSAGLLLLAAVASAQTSAYRPPRGPDGHADISGVYEALNTANWDLEDHSAAQGTMWQTGAINSEPAGESVVEGGTIPYRPAALEKRKANFAARRTNDPEAKCYMPGVPRANYMGYPFQIVQTPRGIMFVYEFASANRLVNMGKPEEAGSDTWMGTNNGHWEGDTLVVDSTNFRPGVFRNISTEKLHVVERFTRTGPDVIEWRVTVDDPGAWTKPWTAMIPLRASKKAVFEYACHEGNYGLADILAGARREDREEAAKSH